MSEWFTKRFTAICVLWALLSFIGTATTTSAGPSEMGGMAVGAFFGALVFGSVIKAAYLGGRRVVRKIKARVA